MANLNVYCIIVTYNAMKWIDKCLGSLRNSSVKVYPVIIDNCSQDQTVSYIRQNYPDVHLIINDVNRGFGQANNQGIEYAYKQEATHFFLLNQDAWVYEDTIIGLIEAQDNHDISICSPIHLNGRGDMLDYNYFMYCVMVDSNIEYVSDLIINTLKPYYTVSKINAAAWMLSRKTVETVGGFDPIFFHYGEDGNYCQRIKYHQGNVAFVTGSFIHHDREIKGNIKVFKKNATISMLLNQYSDINKSVWSLDKTRLRLHLLNLKIALSFLLKLKLKDFGNLCNSYAVFLAKFPKMRNNMKSNKTMGPNWLNLD